MSFTRTAPPRSLKCNASYLTILSTLRFSPRYRLWALLMGCGLLILGCASGTRAQSIQHTENRADQALRSDRRVDPSTLGMSLSIPLGGYPGRAGTDLPITLNYSSKVWRLNHVQSWEATGGLKTQTEALFAEHSTAGWTSSLGVPRIDWQAEEQPYDSVTKQPICVDCATTPPQDQWRYIYRIWVHLPDGSAHEMRKDDVPHSYYGRDFTGVYYSVDSSRLRFETATNTLFLPDGGRYFFGAKVYARQDATQFVDRHGNTLSYNSATRQWTDTLGRVISVPFPAAPAAGYTSYVLPAVNGSTLTYSLRWQNLTDVRTDPSQTLRYPGDRNFNEPPQTLSPSLFTTSGNNRVCAMAIFDPVVLSEIILPNGQSYRFTYNIWGEIDKVYLPTGGYERFRYDKVETASIVTGIYKQTNRGVVERWVSVNGTGSDEARWQYSAATPLNAYFKVTTIAPDLTYNERLIQRGSGSSTINYGFDSALVGTAYDERAFSSTGVMLRRTLTEYTVSGPTPGGESTATRDPRVTKQILIALDTGGNALAAAGTMQYDADLNTTATNSYDYASVDETTAQTGAIGSIPLGTLVRTQEATYLVNDPAIDAGTKDAYRARNLVGLQTSGRARNAAGSIVAQSEVKYDEA
ncbi:MAG: hypothetical protein M3539_03735, partial [Acidobacteriota bacterium]|nr:hypothetical protein [Acidobacteriota bacterium]